MKLITAVIRPSKLDAVREALSAAGVQSITVEESKGFGKQVGHTELYRGAKYVIDFLPRTKIIIAIPSEKLLDVCDAITKSAGTGETGNGRVFVSSIEQAYRIRTGETGESAL